METWAVLAEPEVAEWYAALDDAGAAQANVAIDRLADQGVLLGEPYSRKLDGKLRELRLIVSGTAVRITYYTGSGRRFILLTVFPKTRRREPAQIARAMRVMLECIDEHSHEEED